MKNKKRLTREELFRNADLDVELFTVDDVFENMSSTRYGFYHIATTLCAGIHGLLTTAYIIKDLKELTMDSFRHIKYHFEENDGNFGAIAVSTKTTEEIDFSLDFHSVDEYNIEKYLFKEDLEEYIERKESTGCTLEDAIGADILLIGIQFNHKRIVVMFDSRNERLVLLGKKENNELDVLNPKFEHKFYYAIISSLLSIFLYMDSDESNYRAYDNKNGLKSLDKLITSCNDVSAKILLGQFLVEEIARKDRASDYAQVLIALREAAMNDDIMPEIPNPADKDKLN